MENDYQFAPCATSSLLTKENASAHCHIFSLTTCSERFFNPLERKSPSKE